MRRPDCAISASSPAVLSATVLPPVFGPVTSSTVAGGTILIVTGTARFEERMPRRLQLEGAVGRQPRLDAVDRVARTRRAPAARRARWPPRSSAAGRPRRPRKRVGQREQDAADLLGLLLLERDDVVVDLDRAERLEKQAGAARRGAVHDAGNAAPMLGLHDEHVAAVALGDDLVLQVLRGVLAAQVGLERAAQPASAAGAAVPDDPQLRAGVIDDIARRVDLVARPRRLSPLNEAIGALAAIEEREGRRRRAGWPSRVSSTESRNVASASRRSASSGRPSTASEPRMAGRSSPRPQREGALLADERGRLARGREPAAPPSRGSVDGCEARQALVAHRRQGEAAHRLDDAIELEGPKNSRLHGGEELNSNRLASLAGSQAFRGFRPRARPARPDPTLEMIDRARHAPAPKPLSMLTTDTPDAQLFSMPRSAAIPPKLAP